MDPLVAEFVGAVLRWALTSVGGVLVAKHVITADQSDRFSAKLAEHLVLWLPLGLGLAWSLYAKYRGRLRFIAAQQAPRDTSETDINLAAHSKDVRAQIFTGKL